MREERLKIELSVPEFFSIPMKQVEIDDAPGTGRTYFVHKGRIVAVARRPEIPGGETPPVAA